MNFRKSIFISVIVLWLISCSFVSRLLGAGTETAEATPTEAAHGTPQIINHPRPQLPVNYQPFSEAGCQGENLYVMECATDSPIRALGCDFLTINTLSGGLNPPYPVASCLRREASGEPVDPTSFKKTGCLMPHYQAVIIALEDEFRLVSDLDDFQVYFAPIESEAEALSYAQMVTGLNAVYGRQIDRGISYKYRVDRLEDTQSVKVGDGYVVSLFSGPEPLCGCGIHTFYQRNVLVMPDGQVEVVESIPLYDMEACID